jgi:hypothetical protein
MMDAVDIGGRLELFVDDYLIETMKGVSLKLHHPQPKEVAISFDHPWEGPYSAYVTVIKDGNHYRMYYRGHGDGREEVTCYAESSDGINWIRPRLGLFDLGGRDNNIVWMGVGTHNFAPFLDENPEASPDERYKAVGGAPLRAFVSKDGVGWRMLGDGPIITEGTFDSQNTAFFDPVQGMYVCYLRDYRDGIRQIKRATSHDFIHWTRPEWIDLGDTPREHLYTNGIVPYFRAPHIYLAFPKRFIPHRNPIKGYPEPGLSDAVFMSSRDGIRWRRTFMEAFIRPGQDPKNWTHRSNMPAWGLLQTAKEEISIYWSQHYFQRGCCMRRGVLRLDGFVSLHADYYGGEFITKPILFSGKKLVINYATSAVGHIMVEIQDYGFSPIESFTLKEAEEIYGDEVERIVSWRGRSDLYRFRGERIRLRFCMKDADLYAIRFL